MPVKIGPDRRIRIEIFPPARVPQNRAFATGNHDRLFPKPILHLCERMPHVFVIQLRNLLHGSDGTGPSENRELSAPRFSNDAPDQTRYCRATL